MRQHGMTARGQLRVAPLAAALLALLLCGAPAASAETPTPPPRPEPPRKPITVQPAQRGGDLKPTAPVPASGQSKSAPVTDASPRPGEVGPPDPNAAPRAAGSGGESVTDAGGCVAALRAMGAEFKPADPPVASDPQCTVSDPVRLSSVSVRRPSGVDVVKLAGTPLLACEAARVVTDWVQESVAPLTRGHFDEPLLELGVGGGFECRQRNHQSTAPRSEHSYGRALDVMTFRTATRTIKVEKAPPDAVRPFLEAVWASGCGRFSTALGPEADAFHATHLHVDLQPRRSASSKFCE